MQQRSGTGAGAQTLQSARRGVTQVQAARSHGFPVAAATNAANRTDAVGMCYPKRKVVFLLALEDGGNNALG
jgi:hypothetical protein